MPSSHWCAHPNDYFSKTDDHHPEWDVNLHGHQRCALAGAKVYTRDPYTNDKIKVDCSCPCHTVTDPIVTHTALSELASWVADDS